LTIPDHIYIFVKTCVVFTSVSKDALQSIKDKHVIQKNLMPTKVGISFFKNSIGFFSYELWWVIGGYLLGIVGKN
jgi:hypothetical protein